jgi:hypothetical protein
MYPCKNEESFQQTKFRYLSSLGIATPVTCLEPNTSGANMRKERPGASELRFDKSHDNGSSPLTTSHTCSRHHITTSQ